MNNMIGEVIVVVICGNDYGTPVIGHCVIMLCGQQAVSTISYKIVRMVSSIWREDSDIAQEEEILSLPLSRS